LTADSHTEWMDLAVLFAEVVPAAALVGRYDRATRLCGGAAIVDDGQCDLIGSLGGIGVSRCRR